MRATLRSNQNNPSSPRALRRLTRALAPLLVAGIASSAAPRPLRAQPAPPAVTPAHAAQAEQLFQDGVRLREEGKLGDACPKFAESHRLDPSIGALLSLGDCRDRQGKFASAVAAFLEASRLAAQRGEVERGAEALRRASLVEPKVAVLLIRIKASTPGLVVKRNNETIEPARLGSRLPVDPGEYTIVAEASGYQPFQSSALVELAGQSIVIDIPALTPRAKAEGAPTQEASGRPLTGYVVGGLGIAALGAGAIFGAMAVSNYSKAEDDCSERGCADRAKAVDTLDRADTQAWVANAGIGLGLVGVGVGAYFLFFAPSQKASAPASAGLKLTPGPGAAGLGVGVSF